jgi:single-strand DNA-binding protein
MAADLKFPRINKIIISGHLTREAELRYTPSGTPVAKLSIAFNRVWRDNASGEWREQANFIDVVAWSKLAERCDGLGKGYPVLVEGRIDTRSYTDSNNQNRKVVEIVAENIQFLKATAKSDSEPEESYNESASKSPQITDDDVPF